MAASKRTVLRNATGEKKTRDVVRSAEGVSGTRHQTFNIELSRVTVSVSVSDI